MAVVQRRGLLGKLALDERAAWGEYLDATRSVGVVRYEEVEPWAWARLGRRLAAVQARRRQVEQDDGA